MIVLIPIIGKIGNGRISLSRSHANEGPTDGCGIKRDRRSAFGLFTGEMQQPDTKYPGAQFIACVFAPTAHGADRGKEICGDSGQVGGGVHA